MQRSIVFPIALLLLGSSAYFLDGHTNTRVVERDRLGVVLSFDYEDLIDEAGTRNLGRILDLLQLRGIPATFFVLGATADRHPEMITAILSEGHSLGSHSYYHQFPVFTIDEAMLVGDMYQRLPGEVWSTSLKDLDVFYRDLSASRRAIAKASGRDYQTVLYRSPSLAISSTMNPSYFRTLAMAGYALDSSVYQDFNDPKPYYAIEGVIEVPVVASEARLENLVVFRKIAHRCAKANVPLVLFLHPQRMNSEYLGKLESFLDELEHSYEVTYLGIEEVPTAYPKASALVSPRLAPASHD